MVDDKPFRSQLTEVRPDGTLSFTPLPAKPDTPPAALRTFPSADLVCWGQLSQSLPRRSQLLLFTNGDRLACDRLLKIDEKTLTVDSFAFGEVTLPRRDVAAWIFRPPTDQAVREQLIERLLVRTGISLGVPLTPMNEVAPPNEDQLLLDTGDRLTGRFLGLAQEPITTPDGRASQRDVVRLATAFEPLQVDLSQVQAVWFSSPAPETSRGERLRWVIGLADTSRLTVGTLQLKPGELKLSPVDGAGRSLGTWEAVDKRASGSVVFLQVLGGRSVYVSDLQPALYRHIPYLTVERPFHADRNALGGFLQSNQHTWLKGVGMHSAAMLVYPLAGQRRFCAELALDDAALGTSNDVRGHVEFRILLDNVEQFRTTLSAGSPAVPVSIELGTAKRLMLYVGFADRGDVLDYANWLNARLVK